ncbi:NAD-dependent deacylase [candidate division KSB1 bacterium]|nr:NAD-dependent deacylase [candidate division KSB1 bacterium]
MFSNALITQLKQAQRIGVLTGAGISAESGVPTFRGEDGIWKKLSPAELASMDAFLSNPDLVWEWYSFRRQLIRQVKPNPGHLALATLERKKSDFTLITQNVDNLHRLAGSQHICELHGNIMRNRCVDCNKIITDLECDAAQKVPHCECGGLIRPDVVWFGELLPEAELRTAWHAARTCEVFLVVGTSAQVQPAASLPLEAYQAGAYVVEINLEPTAISEYAQTSILGQAGVILPQLVSLI